MHTRILAATLAPLLLVACAHGPSGRERQNAEIHHALGMEALRAGRVNDAVREFDEAIALDDGYADAWLGKALMLERAYGKEAEAEKAYRRALALAPGFPEAHNNLGQLLARQGRTDEALREFDAAMSEMGYREPWVARMNKGLTLYAANRREEGLAEMRACLRAQPAYCYGRRELGAILLKEGKTQEAIVELQAYARYCDKVPDAHLQLGNAYKRAGDLEKAVQELARCEELSPGTAVGEECRSALEPLRQ